MTRPSMTRPAPVRPGGPGPAPRRRLALAAAVAAAGVLAAACGGSTTAGAPATSTPAPGVSTSSVPASAFVTPPNMAAGNPGTPRGEPTTPPTVTDADQMAAAFATATFSYDTAIDVSPHDAQVRSAVFATPDFATVLTAPVPSTGDAEFTELAAHQGCTTVTLAPNNDDGRPADQLRSAARSFRVTPVGHGTDGWTQPLTSRVMYVFLVRSAEQLPWQVDTVSFTAAGGAR